MAKRISFNNLRRIKDNLPSGSIKQIANEIAVVEDVVRNYFGGSCGEVKGCGIHIEPGPDGGIVVLDNEVILRKALIILGEKEYDIVTQ